MGDSGVCSAGKNNNSNTINDTGNPFISCFFSLPPKQYALLASLLGILLIDSLDFGQQNSLGNFIVSIGQSILTAAAQGQSIEADSQKGDQLRQQIEFLKKQICALEQELK